MEEKRYAVIDIGSNSIRYQDQSSDAKTGVTTRLGSGLAATGRLDEARMKETVSVIAAMAERAREGGFTPLAYATSAVRDCSNRAEFLNRVYAASGVMPDVLSGEREAEYAFRAAAFPGGGLVDIGGASMQLVTGNYRQSFPIGCVRGRDIALFKTGAADCDDGFPSQREAIRRRVRALTLGILPEKACFERCVGVGGTITTLGALALDLTAYDKRIVHGKTLTRAKLEELIDLLLTLGEARRGVPLLKNRHDVILYGAAILAAAMDLLEIQELTVSTRDGLDGYLEAAVSGLLPGPDK